MITFEAGQTLALTKMPIQPATVSCVVGRSFHGPAIPCKGDGIFYAL